MRKFVSIITVLILILNLSVTCIPSAVSAETPTTTGILVSKELKVVGTKVIEVDTQKEVRLTGVNVPSLGWGKGEYIHESVVAALDGWNSNLIRLPVKADLWSDKNETTRKAYLETVDFVIRAASARGKHVILDLHNIGGQPKQEALNFWISAAQVYRNHPTVLFGLYNEPTGSSWPIWRNGDGGDIVGHQKLVETIRDLGAKNIIVAGGLDYAYDITGVVNGYALIDQGFNNDTSKTGNGIIYDTHIYPTKGDNWESKVKPVRALHPVLVGEWGYDAYDEVVTGNNKKAPDVWCNELLAWMDREGSGYGSKMHWTAWNLHPNSSPRAIYNWRFEPTDYFGIFAYNKLKSLNPKTHTSRQYYNNFAPSEDTIHKYTVTRDTASYITHSRKDTGELVLNTQRWTNSNKLALDMEINEKWDLSDINQLTFNLKASQAFVGATLRIGLKEIDHEMWVKDIVIGSGDIKNEISIYTNELTKKENTKGDGVFTGTVFSFYLEVLPTSSRVNGTLEIDSLLMQCGGSNLFKPADVTYIPRQSFEEIIDFDSKSLTFDSDNSSNGPENGDYYTPKTVSGDEGYNGTKSLQISYRRQSMVNTKEKPEGRLTYTFPTPLNFLDGQYFSFLAKGTDTPQTISMKLNSDPGNDPVITLNLKNDEWQQFTFSFDELDIHDPENLKTIRFTSTGIAQGTFCIDNITVSREIPTLNGSSNLKYLVNDFNPDKFTTWTTQVGGNASNTASVSNNKLAGYNGGSAKILTFNRSAGQTSGTAIAKMPLWYFTDIKYISFYIRGDNLAELADRSNEIKMVLKGSQTDLFTATVDVVDDNWQYVVIPLKSDSGFVNIFDLETIAFSAVPAHHAKVVISEFVFSSFDPRDSRASITLEHNGEVIPKPVKGLLTVKASIDNYTPTDKTLYLIAALYENGTNKLIEYKISEPTLIKNISAATQEEKEISVDIDIPPDVENHKLKHFLWEDINGLIPFQCTIY